MAESLHVSRREPARRLVVARVDRHAGDNLVVSRRAVEFSQVLDAALLAEHVLAVLHARVRIEVEVVGRLVEHPPEQALLLTAYLHLISPWFVHARTSGRGLVVGCSN